MDNHIKSLPKVPLQHLENAQYTKNTVNINAEGKCSDMCQKATSVDKKETEKKISRSSKKKYIDGILSSDKVNDESPLKKAKLRNRRNLTPRLSDQNLLQKIDVNDTGCDNCTDRSDTKQKNTHKGSSDSYDTNQDDTDKDSYKENDNEKDDHNRSIYDLTLDFEISMIELKNKEKEIDKLHTKLDLLQKEKKSQENQLQNLRSNAEDLKKEIKALTIRLQNLSEENELLKNKYISDSDNCNQNLSSAIKAEKSTMSRSKRRKQETEKNNQTTVEQLTSTLSDSDVEENNSKSQSLHCSVKPHKKSSKKFNTTDDNLTQEDEYVINKDVIKKCRHDEANHLAHDLLRELFTEEELAMSSASGKKVNANKNLIIRPALNPLKVKAIKDYTISIFKNDTETKSLIHREIRKACERGSKAMKRKKN